MGAVLFVAGMSLVVGFLLSFVFNGKGGIKPLTEKQRKQIGLRPRSPR